MAPDVTAESERIEAAYKAEEDRAYAELRAFAEARNFGLMREQGRMVFTQRDDKGEPLTAGKAHGADPRAARRHRCRPRRSCAPRSAASWSKHGRPRTGDEGGAGGAAAPARSSRCSSTNCRQIRNRLRKQIKDSVKLGRYLDQVQHDVLENLELFQPGDERGRDARRRAGRGAVALRVNVVVDNHGREGRAGDRRRQPAVPLAVRQHRIRSRKTTCW